MRQRGDLECFHESLNELCYYGEDRRSGREAQAGHTYAAFWEEISALARRRSLPRYEAMAAHKLQPT